MKGRIALEVDGASGTKRAQMVPGDCHGELALLTGSGHSTRLASKRGATLATLDRAGLDAILLELPAVARPLAEELAHELHVASPCWKRSALRLERATQC